MNYQIKSGDTLWNIVKNQYGVTTNTDIIAKINEIAKLNNIEDPNLIIAGASLQLPEDTVQTSQEEEAQQETSLADEFNDWVDSHGAAMDEYSAKLADVDKKITELENNPNADINIDEINAQMQEAERQYNKHADEIGNFNFISDGVEIQRSDGTVSFELYAQEGEKLAESLQDSWETDGEEGIDIEEYHDAEIARMGDMEVTQEVEDSIKDAFNMMDLNDDGVIDKSEIQSVYSVVDMADGNVDGQIEIETYSNALSASDTIKSNAIDFQKRLEEDK